MCKGLLARGFVELVYFEVFQKRAAAPAKTVPHVQTEKRARPVVKKAHITRTCSETALTEQKRLLPDRKTSERFDARGGCSREGRSIDG